MVSKQNPQQVSQKKKENNNYILFNDEKQKRSQLFSLPCQAWAAI